ncbi:hypothetical protein RQM59_02530 [Flavobacteriaceae bacterium S356]|uniref:Uncharacterized protein n=1 Tax=Asprobacillus argus TaxID=3076534 RepID=A0ABU3LBX8_9FLAO|nr:hypothetical protein [Flavobacteriaceae bacterium S356]
MKKLIILCASLWLCMGCEAILEDDISNESVVILAPAEGVQLTVGDATFSWQTLENATSYTIQVATPDFANATQIVVNTNTADNSATATLTAGSYQWRVSASNSEYTTGYTTINFTVN